MSSKLVIGNWKMHGRAHSLDKLVSALLTYPSINRPGVIIAPPIVYLAAVYSQLAKSHCSVAAQNVSQFSVDGAYTGEYSAAMLADYGCRYVILGHSERRRYFSESNSVLLSKLQNVVESGLTPVLCVGETLDERETGCYHEVLQQQLAIIAACRASRLIIAYEPIWAIGTGKVASLEQILAVHTQIKEWSLQLLGEDATIPVLYGGSVNAENASGILSLESVDGVLVGGASLNAESFAIICQAAKKLV